MTADVVHNLKRLTNARSVEELWDIHTGLMADFGFDRVMYGYSRYLTSNSLGDPQDWVLLSSQTPEYMKIFFEEKIYNHGPMLKWALENDGACSWRYMFDRDKLTPDEMRVMEINRQMKVTAGYTISFRSVSERTKGAVSLTAKPELSQNDVEAVWEEHGETIVILNNVMHLKLLTLPYTGERNLTKRQREVLQWVGDGKTTQDIAILLGLTAATVEKHLRLARDSLDVETTAQAVLKAAFYNQMFTMDVDT